MPNELVNQNLQLHDQLTTLIEQARDNEKIMQRHQLLDLEFIGALGLPELIKSIFQLFPALCDLDVVTLVLVDPGHQIGRILTDLRVDVSGFPGLLFVEHGARLGRRFERMRKPLLGPYIKRQHGRMFPESGPAPASVASVPLLRQGRVIGWLNLGSADASRFIRGMATDFLEHRASIIAICLENVINHERLKHIGLTDPLTGVNNRRYVEQRLLEEVGRTRRQGYALSCMYIDIDHFKQINDSVGHQAGDMVLREVAVRIKAELRLSDALARFGGEEFVVLLIDAGLVSAQRVAERIRRSIAEKPLALNGGELIDVTVSIGVATLSHPDSPESIDRLAQDLIACADRALYEAKKSGRNTVVLAG